MSADAVKKKVKPYPIPVQLNAPSGVIRGNIIKLVGKGFIANLEGKFVYVNDVMQVSFQIPVSKHDVLTEAVVIKTYDRVNPGHPIERLSEMHFAHISDNDKNHIVAFLRAIKQTEE